MGFSDQTQCPALNAVRPYENERERPQDAPTQQQCLVCSFVRHIRPHDLHSAQASDHEWI